MATKPPTSYRPKSYFGFSLEKWLPSLAGDALVFLLRNPHVKQRRIIDQWVKLGTVTLPENIHITHQYEGFLKLGHQIIQIKQYWNPWWTGRSFILTIPHIHHEQLLWCWISLHSHWKKCSSGSVFHGTKPGSRSPAGLSFGLAQVSEVYPIARCASDTPKKTARPSARL